MGLQGLDPVICLCHPALAFKIKRLGDNTHRQNALIAGSLRNNRGRTCTCAAAHASGDEHHIGISDFSHHLF